jgi:hypothetical protein
MSIGMTPFREFYRCDAPSFVELQFGDNRAPKAKDRIQESHDILKALKDNLQTTKNQQKLYADRHRVEHTFEVGNLVFLRLQPYIQYSLNKSRVENLKPCLYGPYRVVWRVGEVAYELELLEGRKIQNMFHVSCLKKALGKQVTTSPDLPPLDEEGKLILVPEEVLEVRERKLCNNVIQEYLIRWWDIPVEDATWEGD